MWYNYQLRSGLIISTEQEVLFNTAGQSVLPNKEENGITPIIGKLKSTIETLGVGAGNIFFNEDDVICRWTH